MKLTILSSEFPPGPGGLGTHAYHTAKQLAARGWDVNVLSPQDYALEHEIAEFNTRLEFPLTRLLSRHGWFLDGIARARQLEKVLRSHKPDALVLSGQRSVWLGDLMGHRLSIPRIAIAHGSEFGPSPRWAWHLTRRSFARVNAVVAVSVFTSGIMHDAGIESRELYVIPNGADERMYFPHSEEETRHFRQTSIPRAQRILLTVGQLSDRKGQETVIRALPEILRHHPDTLYVMVGQPTIQQKLERIASELGVDTHICIAGRVSAEELPAWYNACDLFLMTSRMLGDGDCEGYGISAVEAALCGKPAVVSGKSGLAEAVSDGVTGIIVSQNDPATVAVAVTSLLDDEQHRLRMGTKARTRAVNEQTWEKRGEVYNDTLRGIILRASDSRRHA